MRAVWLVPGKLEIREQIAEPLGFGEARIKVGYVGICGSDREMFVDQRPVGFYKYPIIPGHEWSGTVAEVGPGVSADLVGKKVIGEGFWSCQSCANCRRGDTNLCTGPYRETGFTEPGGWADFLVIPARLLHTLPDDIDLRHAATLEPSAVIASAMLKANPRPGDRVAIVGAGMLGLLASQFAAATGPSDLVIVNRSPIDPALLGTAKLVNLDEAKEIAGTFDVVIEASASPVAAQQAISLTRRGGRVVLTGIPGGEATMSVSDVVTGQLELHTVFGANAEAWDFAARALASGILDPEKFITHEFVLEDAMLALDTLADKSSGARKILLHP